MQIFKRLITKLYNRYCVPDIKTMYLEGVQRDFSVELTPPEQQARDVGCNGFVNSGACKYIFNEILKEYVDTLFNLCETQEMRDAAHHSINVVLKVEREILAYSSPNTEKVDSEESTL